MRTEFQYPTRPSELVNGAVVLTQVLAAELSGPIWYDLIGVDGWPSSRAGIVLSPGAKELILVQELRPDFKSAVSVDGLYSELPSVFLIEGSPFLYTAERRELEYCCRGTIIGRVSVWVLSSI